MTRSPLLHSTLILALIGTLLFTLGCDSATVSPGDHPKATQQDVGGMAANQTTSNSTVPVLTFATGKEVGSSKLVRTDNGVSFKLSTTGLKPGTVHTLWMVIFNEPENCTDPGCGTDDLVNLDATPELTYAAGTAIGGSGKATFAGHRNEGDNGGSIMEEWLGLPEPGLETARGAEIHFVVHSHGPKIPGLVNEMLHTFNAGCGPVFSEEFPRVPQSLGTYGPNTCRDVQFAVHSP